MSEDLQSLLEKINRDGVEKAEAEAMRIVEDAKAKAAAILKEAKEEGAKIKAEGERFAADYTSRAKESLAQAARDTVLKVELSVTGLLTKLLEENVDKALADGDVVLSIVKDAIKGLTGNVELFAGEKIANSLKAALASLSDVTVIMDETISSGFRVKHDGGRVEHDFTGETVAKELSKRLRSDLAMLLKQ